MRRHWHREVRGKAWCLSYDWLGSAAHSRHYGPARRKQSKPRKDISDIAQCPMLNAQCLAFIINRKIVLGSRPASKFQANTLRGPPLNYLRFGFPVRIEPQGMDEGTQLQKHKSIYSSAYPIPILFHTGLKQEQEIGLKPGKLPFPPILRFRSGT